MKNRIENVREGIDNFISHNRVNVLFSRNFC